MLDVNEDWSNGWTTSLVMSDIGSDGVGTAKFAGDGDKTEVALDWLVIGDIVSGFFRRFMEVVTSIIPH